MIVYCQFFQQSKWQLRYLLHQLFRPLVRPALYCLILIKYMLLSTFFEILFIVTLSKLIVADTYPV